MPTDEQRKRLWVAIETKRLSVEDKQTRRIHDALQDSIQPVLTRLNEQGPQDAIDDVESELNENAIREVYKDLYGEVGLLFAGDTFEGLLPKRKQDDTLDNIWLDRMREFATTEAGERIKEVAKQTVTKIRNVLENGIQEGHGIEKIAREIERSSWVSRTRARRIARTEIVSASNEGSMMGARSTSLNLQKEWLDTPDSRTRFTHVEAGRQDPIDINESFRVGGYQADYPGDPSLPASEVVNCRCTQAFIPYD